MTSAPRDTYKYFFKVGNVIVHRGITNNLQSRESQNQNSGRSKYINGVRLYWSNGHISQVGNITTSEAALEWERDQHARFGGT